MTKQPDYECRLYNDLLLSIVHVGYYGTMVVWYCAGEMNTIRREISTCQVTFNCVTICNEYSLGFLPTVAYLANCEAHSLMHPTFHDLQHPP